MVQVRDFVLLYQEVKIPTKRERTGEPRFFISPEELLDRSEVSTTVVGIYRIKKRKDGEPDRLEVVHPVTETFFKDFKVDSLRSNRVIKTELNRGVIFRHKNSVVLQVIIDSLGKGVNGLEDPLSSRVMLRREMN